MLAHLVQILGTGSKVGHVNVQSRPQSMSRDQSPLVSFSEAIEELSRSSNSYTANYIGTVSEPMPNQA